MSTGLDHSHWRNLRHSGFVAVVFAAILSAGSKPLSPTIDSGEFLEGEVVVARFEIPQGGKIMAEQLTLASIPNGCWPEGAFRKLDQVVGRVAITPIGVREPITNLKLAPDGTGGGLSAVIPPGYRAMTVKVDDVVGVSGFIMPGSFVDVVAIITPVETAKTKRPISKIVLQNIKVLASGPRIDSPENQRQPSQVNAVTLQVTPEQAEKLVLAANEGRLQFVLRNYADPGK